MCILQMFWKNLAVFSCYFIVCVLTAIARQLLTFGVTLHSRKFPASHRYIDKCLFP